MTIDLNNQYAIEDLYLHDSIFQGFCYDYESREISFACYNPHQRTKHSILLKNIVAFNVQSCEFWGAESRIYDIWIDKEPTYFEQLLQLQKLHKQEYEFSCLDKGVSYISVVIQLVSGDEFKFTCQTIEVEIASRNDDGLRTPY